MYCRGPFRRLLYTQGKGYIRNRMPDLDEEEYCRYALTLKDSIQFLGNVYADPSFLIDREDPAVNCSTGEESRP